MFTINIGSGAAYSGSNGVLIKGMYHLGALVPQDGTLHRGNCLRVRRSLPELSSKPH